jgi:hypothetical protein
MANGIEFFLTHRVRDPEDDYRGWEWYVLDSEGLHQDILQILLNRSAEFCQNLIDHDGKCIRSSQLFDLTMKSPDDSHTCLELKVDNPWSEDQRLRQLSYLRQTSNAKGALILFTNQSLCLTRERIAMLAGDVASKVKKISYSELYAALDIVHGSPSLNEFAAAYKLALKEQEARTRVRGDPNL